MRRREKPITFDPTKPNWTRATLLPADILAAAAGLPECPDPRPTLTVVFRIPFRGLHQELIGALAQEFTAATGSVTDFAALTPAEKRAKIPALHAFYDLAGAAIAVAWHDPDFVLEAPISVYGANKTSPPETLEDFGDLGIRVCEELADEGYGPTDILVMALAILAVANRTAFSWAQVQGEIDFLARRGSSTAQP